MKVKYSPLRMRTYAMVLVVTLLPMLFVALAHAFGAREARAMERLDVHLNRILEMGFLRRLPDQQLEVRRILKTFVDAQWIAGLESGLGQYRAHLVSGADEP